MWRDTFRWRRQGNYLNEKASLGYILSFSSARERERREAGGGEGRNGERGREKMERGRKREWHNTLMHMVGIRKFSK